MEQQFYNQPVVNWAKQALAQPVEIKQRFSSRWAGILIYGAVYLFPVLVVIGAIVRKLTATYDPPGWRGVILCGGVILIPPTVIVLLGTLTQQKLVKSLDAEGVRSSMGRRYLWQDLYCVDHVSKHYRAGGVSQKIEDNQLELVFANGKTIVPPLIHNRERIWSLINSMPVEVRFDGEIKTVQPQNPAGAADFNDIVKAMEK